MQTREINTLQRLIRDNLGRFEARVEFRGAVSGADWIQDAMESLPGEKVVVLIMLPWKRKQGTRSCANLFRG